jgi:tetratricopeptide (TPR) repeat protein
VTVTVETLEALYRRGQYAAVVRELERLREDSPWEDALSAGKAYYYGAMAHYRLSQPAPAVALITKALDELHVSNDSPWIGRVRFQAGEVYRFAGHAGEAQHWTELFLADMDAYQVHEPARGKAHYNLGLIRRQQKDIPGSVAEYEQAETHLRDVGNTAWMVRAQENLCWVLVEAGQVVRAEAYLHKIEAALATLGEDAPDLRELQLSFACNRAFVLLHSGRAGAAVHFCQEVVADDSGATLAQRAFAAWIAAECALAMADPEAARKLLAGAGRFAAESGDARIMNYISATRAKLT